MRDQICKVTVHNVPEYAKGYIVARVRDESLWFWGCWDNESDAKECATTVEETVINYVPDINVGKMAESEEEV